MLQKRSFVWDTFRCIKELTKAGFQQEQAEAQVKLMVELVSQTLCTREDMENSEERLSLKIESVRKELTVEIENVRKDLTLHITQAKHEMIKWLVAMSLAGLGLMFTMFKFLV